MAEASSFGAEGGRLTAQLAAMLGPEIQDALAHPVRREVLRALNRAEQPRSVAELGAGLGDFRPSHLSYHLRVLRNSGAVAWLSAGDGIKLNRARFVSEVRQDSNVRAVLRATERGDREHREAAAAANSSPLLTMFRVPRPTRILRLRARSKADPERDR